MKLIELYEDLFQYLCRLNRIAKTQSHPDYARVRSDINELIEQVERNASADVRVLNQVKRLEFPLLFCVDFLIRTSRLKFASQWGENSLARERNELAGDERFFDFVEEDLKDPSEEAAERLLFYYTCFGLGFMGMYLNQSDTIHQYQDKIFPRVRHWMINDPKSKISEEAYNHTNTSILTEPPSNKIIFVAIAFVFVTLSVVVIFYGLYAGAVQDLRDSVKTIQTEAVKKG